MIIESFNTTKHYSLLVEWCKARNYLPPSLDELPVSSFLVRQGDKHILFGCIYYTGTTYAMFEHLISNPASTSTERADAIDVWISCAKIMASTAGVKVVAAKVAVQSLVDRAVSNHEITIGETNITNLYWRLA